jgi:hypothetical protein
VSSADASPRFLTGAHHGWHAIDASPYNAGCTAHAWSACGEIVRLAKCELQPYDPLTVPVSHDPCPACRWTVAARTGTLDAALAELKNPLANEVAAAILNEACRDRLDDDGDSPLDDPQMLHLLAAVSRHAPVLLLSEACAEGDCGHGEFLCGERYACRACSLQAGSWAGEWEGQYLEECTILAPCAPLLALAAHYGVAPGGSGPESPGPSQAREDAIRYDERRRVLDAARRVTVLMKRTDDHTVAAVQWSELLEALGMKP